MGILQKNISSNIVTPYLKVEKNCLEIQNICIQLSNISLISTTNVAPPKVSNFLFSLLILFLGLFSLAANILLGLGVSTAGIIMVYLWFKDYKASITAKCLTIVTNSGNLYPIVFQDGKFMEQVLSVMTEIIRDPVHMKGITVDIRNNKFTEIENSQFLNSSVNGDVKNML